MIHLDTSFLIDLLREERAGGAGAAHELLGRLQDEEVAVSLFVLCELYAGAEAASRPAVERRRVEEIAAALRVAVPDEEFAPSYGRMLADLHRRGAAIGTMDLLIATSALCEDAALASRNRRHFERVPGLEVISY